MLSLNLTCVLGFEKCRIGHGGKKILPWSWSYLGTLCTHRTAPSPLDLPPSPVKLVILGMDSCKAHTDSPYSRLPSYPYFV